MTPADRFQNSVGRHLVPVLLPRSHVAPDVLGFGGNCGSWPGSSCCSHCSDRRWQSDGSSSRWLIGPASPIPRSLGIVVFLVLRRSTEMTRLCFPRMTHPEN